VSEVLQLPRAAVLGAGPSGFYAADRWSERVSDGRSGTASRQAAPASNSPHSKTCTLSPAAS